MTIEDRDPALIAEENRGALASDLGADEIEGRQPAPAAEGNEPGEKEQPKPIPVKSGPFEDKRKAIAEKAKALRDGKNPEIDQQIASARARMVGDNVDVPGLPEEPAEKPEAQPQARPEKHKLKVNGRDVELDHEQVIAAAQKAIAAEDILEQAKQAKAEARELLESVRQARPAHQPAAEPAPQAQPQPAATTPQADVDMDEVIDRIQVGSPEEAKAALEKFGDRIEGRLLAKIGNLDETIATAVDTITENRRRQEDTRTTLAAFGEANPEFATSRALQGALALEAADTMRANMKGIGVEDSALAGYIERVRKENPSFNETQAVGHAYRFLQNQGYELPSHRDVLDKSSASIRQQMGLPAQAAKPAANTPPQPASPPAPTFNSQERERRKREMTPQPRRASVHPSSDAQERSRDDVRRNAVAQMRAARGKR